MKFRYIKIIIVCSGITVVSSCNKMLDINRNPDAIPDSNSPIAQLLTSAQVNLGFEGGSDLYRYSTVIMQQMSGEASQPNQTYEYYRYNITGSDENNVWSSIFSTTLSDLELIIKKATASGSPYYTGIAKILKAYEYSLVVDVWGDVPYTEAQQLSENTAPHYDDDATIYPKLITLLSEAVTDLNAVSSVLTPGTNSIIYPGAFGTVKANWIKLANTLRLRLLLHYSKKDPAFSLAQMTALINTAGITFMASNADNFQHPFFAVANQRNPISQFEVSRPNYLFADARMVNLMNDKSDPRRPFYFTDFPWGSGTYLGVSATSPPPTANNNYSRIHTFLRGAVTAGTVPPFTYSGAAPQRMLSFAEYNFIRAEAALMGAPGDPQAFFTAGITASMTEAGVSAANITTYLVANGTLIGTNAQKLKQIIEEKYIALFGVSVEPWTDWRRTGYPVLTVPTNAITSVTAVPRTFFYPQSEIDLNPNHPPQKNASLQDKVFWDN
ncbi:MAG TPA: SusD/RagB family nutrient-binding outer membrane lipoprotein, partial [Chitinophagaceae bacterium]|nr:SusD/RagB family nutrient-binding outer membrane lipoprotein [Chitinophagaceae bacterium]